MSILLAISESALAQTVAIELPAQPLSEAIATLARQAKVNILVADVPQANRRVPAMSGKLTVREALTKLLENTGLKAEQRRDGTWVIVAPSTTISKPLSSNANETATVLPTINVADTRAPADLGFVTESTTTATRTDTPISQTAQSIQVINQEAIKSTQAQSVVDALAYTTSGVGITDTGMGSPVITIRGFSAKTMSNGVNDAGNGSTQSPNSLGVPMAGIERIEVLKGADSILSGVMDPGGVVNVVYKQPTAVPVHELTVQTGSYGNWLGAIDLGGPLTLDNRLTYRFVLSADRAGESFGGYDGGKSFYVAPSLGWKSGSTEVVVGYQHNVQNKPPVPITEISEVSGPLPLNGQSLLPSVDSLMQSDTLYASLKQQLGPYFLFESKSQYQTSRSKTAWSDQTSETYSIINGQFSSFGFDTDNHLRAKFAIGPIRQTLLVGFDYQKYWSDTYSILPSITPGQYGYYDFGKFYFSNVYLQDQLSWGRLHVLGSIAHGTTWGGTVPSQSAWVPNVGVLYQLTDSVAVYANALRSFTPQIGELLLDGESAPPATGRSVEAGFKFNFLDDRLSLTADVFRSAVMNQATPIPGNSGGFFYLSGGRVTRGVELNATGRLLPGVNLISSYTYGNTPKSSSVSGDLPRHTGSLWLTWDLPGERWHGWGVGAGLQARSGYQLAVPDLPVYRVPGQMQTDLSVYYRAKRWNTTLAVKNLFNRTLYQPDAATDGTIGFVNVNPGRLIYLTSRYDF
ncbi:TonB-dependent siderophore receptor [Burkholderia cepacia]|uniref:TonB-dependent siderophore receptor n=1 Tax=Burkholderia cepacia TaxID=292 RepID=UPI002AB7609D|nr:TonB-dependent receptor [Burkholderia cepacia]